jgi:hypothetical protein
VDIHLIFDKSVDLAPKGFKSAMEDSARILDKALHNAITVNINVGWNEVGGNSLAFGDLAEGGPVGGSSLSYQDLVSQLTKHASNPLDRQELKDLAGVSNGAVPSYYITNAQMKAWGIEAARGKEEDGIIGLSSQYTYSFNPNHRAVAGEYDAIGIGVHEMTHALGRIESDGGMELIDYYKPGILDRPNLGGYYSIDGGNTNLGNFAPSPGDTSDWSTTGNDAFNYQTQSGMQINMSRTDLQLMGNIGFDVGSMKTPHTSATVQIACTHANKMQFV